MGEAELHKAGLAQVGAQPARLFQVLFVGELGGFQALQQFLEVFPLHGPGVHGEEGRIRGFSQLDEILPTLGIILGLPHHALHFLVVHVAGEAAHAVALDESGHIVLHSGEIIKNGRHRVNFALYDFWRGATSS